MAVLVECLNCGETREARRDERRRVGRADCCARCGYVGWAPVDALTERARQALRDRPPARRRLLSLV